MSGKIWNNRMGLIKSILARVKTDSKGQVFMQPMHAYHLNKRMGIGKKKWNSAIAWYKRDKQEKRPVISFLH